MPARHRGGFATGRKLLRGVGAGDVEQAILHGRATHIGGDQGFRHQIADPLIACTPVIAASAATAMAEFKRKPAAENRQASQDRLLLRGQDAMAPVKRRAQRLLPRECGTANGGQRHDGVAKPLCQAAQPIEVDARGGQFDGQGNAIEPPADLYHNRHVGIGEDEAIQAGDGPLDK